MNKHIQRAALAAGVVIASASVASAATVQNDLNLRSGPGTNYRVIDTMPAGAYVNVLDCDGSWCRVSFRGEQGYASASYLGGGGGAYAAAPVYAAPPVVSFGFGFGGPRRHWNRGWHDRGWRHQGWRHNRHDRHWR